MSASASGPIDVAFLLRRLGTVVLERWSDPREAVVGRAIRDLLNVLPGSIVLSGVDLNAVAREEAETRRQLCAQTLARILTDVAGFSDLPLDGVTFDLLGDYVRAYERKSWREDRRRGTAPAGSGVLRSLLFAAFTAVDGAMPWRTGKFLAKKLKPLIDKKKAWIGPEKQLLDTGQGPRQKSDRNSISANESVAVNGSKN